MKTLKTGDTVYVVGRNGGSVYHVHSIGGSVLIWILAFGFIFCGCYAQRLHPFQPPIDKASVQVLKVLDLLPLHAVQKLDISSDNEYLPPSSS